MDQLPSPREAILNAAKDAVMGGRESAYGGPEKNLGRAAKMATAMLGYHITAANIAQIMICVKLSRLQQTPEHTDSWVDMAGYAACGFEAASA